MATFKINIGNWTEYWADASLRLPDDPRMPVGFYKTVSGTTPFAVIATTSTRVYSGYCLNIDASPTGTGATYVGHVATQTPTAPFVNDLFPARGWTVEAQVKVISAGSSAPQYIHIWDGTYREYLELGTNYIGLDNANLTYPMDTTDDFHKYRITGKDTTMKVYVDDILRITVTLSLASTTKVISFGDVNAGANCGGQCHWAYFRYTTLGAYPPNENIKDGWVFDKFDIQDRRRLSEYSIIRSDNNIVPEGKMQAVKLRLSGTVAGSCWGSFRDTVAKLKRLLNAGTQKIYMDDTRFIEGLHSGFNLRPITQNFAEFDADFTCRYPFWRKLWASYFSTAPVTAATFYVTNNGDVEVPCKIIITGAASGTISNNIQLQNVSLDQLAKYTGVLAQTQELTIDKGFDTYNTYQILVGTAQSYGSYEGDLFNLQPGQNTLVFVGGAVGTIEIYWREAYLL